MLLLSACADQKKEVKNITVKKSDIVMKSLGINGMTCVGCEVTLESTLSKIEGVVTVKASASTDSAAITYDKSRTDVKTITKAIKTLGYEVK